MSNLGLLRVWYRRVWEETDADAIDDLLSPDASIAGLEEGLLTGVESFKQFWRLVCATLDEIRPVILTHVSEGEWIAAELRIDATVRATGAPISVRKLVMARWVDGKIVEGANMIDFIGVFEQLGIMPPRTLDHCLLGRKMQFRRAR